MAVKDGGWADGRVGWLDGWRRKRWWRRIYIDRREDTGACRELER